MKTLTPSWRTGLLSSALLGLGATDTTAQGTAFTYQGRLNEGANPANGSYNFKFALFNASSSAGQVGNSLTNTATVVSNGLFTVMLDFSNQFPGASRWLEIGVSTNGNGAFTTLTPRQQLTPVPYAITAGGATNFAGSLVGDVTGTQGATVVAAVGGQTAANVASGASVANAATSANTASTIVKRDASGNFVASSVTASVIGNGSGLTALNAGNLASGIIAGARLSTNERCGEDSPAPTKCL